MGEDPRNPPAVATKETLRERILERLLTDLDAVARFVVVMTALSFFGVILLIGFLKADTWDQTMELLNLALPVVSAILGGAIGYFFRKDKG